MDFFAIICLLSVLRVKMKYYYTPPKEPPKYGQIYICDHDLYNKCTLYLLDGKGLAVVQLKFDCDKKVYYWDRINHALANDIYRHPHFREYFSIHADEPIGELYPTVNVRSLMWELRMKPLKKEWWESQNILTFK